MLTRPHGVVLDFARSASKIQTTPSTGSVQTTDRVRCESGELLLPGLPGHLVKGLAPSPPKLTLGQLDDRCPWWCGARPARGGRRCRVVGAVDPADDGGLPHDIRGEPERGTAECVEAVQVLLAEVHVDGGEVVAELFLGAGRDQRDDRAGLAPAAKKWPPARVSSRFRGRWRRRRGRCRRCRHGCRAFQPRSLGRCGR